MGQLPEGTVTLIEDIDDARAWVPQNPANVAFLTQTTLSVDDTAEMVDLLKTRFPGIAAPHKEDICYATTNRQEAVKLLAGASELILVVGSKNSSNSVRLMEVGKRAGAKDARLIDDARGIDWSWFEGVSRVGVTAGASAPEDLVQGVIEAMAARYDITVEELVEARETVTFKLPRLLTA
jgi:4-hydroxy-3-methylbut-2-enyl diphosphate reductase